MTPENLINKLNQLDVDSRLAYIEQRGNLIEKAIKQQPASKDISTLLKLICESYIQLKQYQKISYTYYNLLENPEPEQMVKEFGTDLLLLFSRAHFQSKRYDIAFKFYEYAYQNDLLIDKNYIENFEELTKKPKSSNFRYRLFSSILKVITIGISIFLAEFYQPFKTPIYVFAFFIVMGLLWIDFFVKKKF
ncbi:hypothetical protein [Chondrinema litorale]|uniref:hypothetical protein n=1 Tax=Chondrinema litorale TaxID=2994555 RepID=UPI0025433B92|nr:hypothetical protein [Chondrinema litorale]UZR98583.1 hypothetical protein OQ292_32665 [Chondrinema litorale]